MILLRRSFQLVAAVFLLPLLARGADLTFSAVPAGTRWEDLPKVLPAVGPTGEPADAVALETADAGDYYVTPTGARVRLLRATNSVAVEWTGTAAKGLAKVQARSGVAMQRKLEQVRMGGGRRLQILQTRTKKTKLDRAALLAEPTVNRAFPVLFDAKTRSRMILTDEVLVRFGKGVSAAQAAARLQKLGLVVVKTAKPNVLNVWCARLAGARSADGLAVCRGLKSVPGVLWAQPNFLREIRRSLQPGNALFPDQQALANTGQNGAVPGADVKATAAWSRTTGQPGVVIAIIDDGVDTKHPALRIFTNPGESGGGKETNGIDDDGDGLVDDVHGWDFANGDNNPDPVGTNGHGTGCAGIAGAAFGSGSPTAGIAPGCTILPVKIADDNGNFTTDQIIGDALLYAARFADVLSNSWGGGSPSAYIEAAIDYATTLGRGGKGCPAFFATGNAASTWEQGGGRYRIFLNGFGGDYYIGFFYLQGSGTGGENAVRLDNVCLLDADGYTHKTSVLADEDFEGSVPGWFVLSSVGVTSNWTLSFENALTGTGGLFSVVSPRIQTGQVAVLASPYVHLLGTETLAFAASVSLPSDPNAGVYFVLLNNQFSVVAGAGPLNGVPDVTTATTYPASYGNAIAVGAATDCDLRADFSQYGGKIDFVAPSNGGWNDIATLDPVGAVGWTAQDYKMNFGGTSAATPLAAGIAALMLTEDPTLTAAEVRTLMHESCDQIGGVTYDASGTNPFYGYGRVNAQRALSRARPVLTIADATVAGTKAGTNGTAVFTLSLSDPAIREVTVDFATLDGTALAGTHYTGESGSVTFPPGATSQTVNVPVLGSEVSRPYLSFQTTLSGVTAADLERTAATGKILAFDADNDGMPDYWETEFLFNPADVADALRDDDNDGFTNWQEYLAGTDPHDATSHLGIPSLAADATGLHLTFATVLDRFYTVEASQDLSAGSWQPLVMKIPGTGVPQEVLDAAALETLSRRFYRVRAEP